MSELWRGRSIDFDEFCEICSKIPQTSVKDLLKAFKRVDRNGDGFISNSELQRMLTSVSAQSQCNDSALTESHRNLMFLLFCCVERREDDVSRSG